MANINIYISLPLHWFNKYTLVVEKERKKKGTGRRFWIRPLFANRAISGAYESLVLKMKKIDRRKKFVFVRMSPNQLYKAYDYEKMQLERPNH